MTITSLKLDNFRCWKNYSINFSDINILIGPNGIGKTNILESIWLLADGRSWRTNHDLEAINWDADFAKITANISNQKEVKIELILSRANLSSANPPSGGKILKINSVKRRLIDLLGQMPAVLFCPESINMISGAPSLRRKFLDILLSQINRDYTLALLEYFKILKARNHLLENIKYKKSQEDELDFWDEKLAENGKVILKERKKVIEFFNQHLTKTYRELSNSQEKMRIAYQQTISEENFLEHLIGNREREIEQGATTSGPHRDDWSLYLNDIDLSTFGSRGEYRSAILALKVLELCYLKEERNEPPILLLDDIFSELDASRRKHLSKIITNQQTIITTTDLDHIEKNLREKAKIIEL